MFDTKHPIKINKTFVEKAPLPIQSKAGTTAQKKYYDKDLKGFGLRVTSGGTKAFFVEKMVNNKLQRITIGRYSEISAEQARKNAQTMLGKMVQGIDPVAEKKAKRIKGITLGQVFDDYINARKGLKQNTILDYKRSIRELMSDWLNKPITNINREMIVTRHEKFGKEHSEARANLGMRLLRALFNFAIHQYQLEDGKPMITVNPVTFLSHVKSWYRVDRRQTVIKPHQLADWYNGVLNLSKYYTFEQACLWQNYFLLMMFTGMRKTETASMEWSSIDLKDRTFTIHDTKNRDSHTLPMSDFIFEIFKRRSQYKINNYVFPSESNNSHIVEPRKALQNIIKSSDVEFSIHDLRRTDI